MRRQQPDAFNEPGLEAEISVLGLQQAADALDQGNGGQRLEIFVGRRAPFERRVGHDPADPAVLPGKAGYPFRFLHVQAGVAFALHEDHLLHLDLSAGLPVFIQQVPLIQQRNIVQPAVSQVFRVPEMHVGVYNGEVHHGEFSFKVCRLYEHAFSLDASGRDALGQDRALPGVPRFIGISALDFNVHFHAQGDDLFVA